MFHLFQNLQVFKPERIKQHEHNKTMPRNIPRVIKTPTFLLQALTTNQAFKSLKVKTTKLLFSN